MIRPPRRSTLFPCPPLFRSPAYSGRLSRGSDPASYPTKPLGSYHAHRRLQDRKSTRLNSSHQIISYAVFYLKKKKHTDSRLFPFPTHQTVRAHFGHPAVLLV